MSTLKISEYKKGVTVGTLTEVSQNFFVECITHSNFFRFCFKRLRTDYLVVSALERKISILKLIAVVQSTTFRKELKLMEKSAVLAPMLQ